MHHPFQETERIKAAVFTSLPGRFRRKGSNEWTAANRGGVEREHRLRRRGSPRAVYRAGR
jgi:hypothetical protein